jgi:hypothetical protein
MGMISLVEHVVQALTGGTASKIAADEVKAWSPWLAERLTKFAVKQLPESDRERYAEEWDSHVADTPGSVGKICVAFGLLFAALKIRRASALPVEIQVANALLRMLMVLTLKLIPPLKRLNGRYAGRPSIPWYMKKLMMLCLRITLLELTWALRLMGQDVA